MLHKTHTHTDPSSAVSDPRSLNLCQAVFKFEAAHTLVIKWEPRRSFSVQKRPTTSAPRSSPVPEKENRKERSQRRVFEHISTNNSFASVPSQCSPFEPHRDKRPACSCLSSPPGPVCVCFASPLFFAEARETHEASDVRDLRLLQQGQGIATRASADRRIGARRFPSEVTGETGETQNTEVSFRTRWGSWGETFGQHT